MNAILFFYYATTFIFSLFIVGCATTEIVNDSQEEVYREQIDHMQKLDRKFILDTNAKIAIAPISWKFIGVKLKDREKKIIFEYLKNSTKKYWSNTSIIDSNKTTLQTSLNQLWMNISGQLGDELVAKLVIGLGAQYIIQIRIVQLVPYEYGKIYGLHNEIIREYKAEVSALIIDVENLKVRQSLATSHDKNYMTALKSAVEKAIKKVLII